MASLAEEITALVQLGHSLDTATEIAREREERTFKLDMKKLDVEEKRLSTTNGTNICYYFIMLIFFLFEQSIL